jgi:hypothetical protein
MATKQPAGSESGSFGSVSYDGNTLTIEIASDSLGGIALTSGLERIECFWDGTQWVCNGITFGANSQ